MNGNVFYDFHMTHLKIIVILFQKLKDGVAYAFHFQLQTPFVVSSFFSILYYYRDFHRCVENYCFIYRIFYHSTSSSTIILKDSPTTSSRNDLCSLRGNVSGSVLNMLKFMKSINTQTCKETQMAYRDYT